jgi:hypothetical protein
LNRKYLLVAPALAIVILAANWNAKSDDDQQPVHELDARPNHGQAPALHFYQLALQAPIPPEGSFDQNAALRGKQVFENNGRCATCHVLPLYTEPGWNMHSASEIGVDDFQANRAPDNRYRTSPLKGLWTHTQGGFYHDGRFATLGDVVNHYDDAFELALTEQEKGDLVEYL